MTIYPSPAPLIEKGKILLYVQQDFHQYLFEIHNYTILFYFDCMHIGIFV